MPGVVQDYINQKNFREGFERTSEHLNQRYFEASTSNGWDAAEGKRERWTNQEEREAVRQIAHSENRFIARAQSEAPAGRYAVEEPYRHGAREAVMEFSRENNHRLLEREREQERTAQQETVRVRVA